MFRTCFVARVAVERDRSTELFCSFTDPQQANSSAEALPPPQALGNFCFPLGSQNVKPKEYMAPEEYSFTLTTGDGSRLHGFCRTFLPPRTAAAVGRTNNSLRYPQVLCVISQYPWFAFYYKVLQVTEQLLKQDNVLNSYKATQLAQTHPAGLFLLDLCHQCPQLPIPGKVIRVDYPNLDVPLSISPPKRIGWIEGADQLLNSSDKFIELEIPPDFGNGTANAGIPLARLLWHVPAQGLMTLLAGLLLERRVILVAPSTDTVSAAVHAAAALLYPFTWQHIYLPLLPMSLKDYLTAPMPFLIGLQSSMLPMLKHLPMDEVTLIDLELGTCEPPTGSPQDAARLLPWSDRLHAALQVVYDGLRSPTEYESTPLIAHVLQEYFLRLVGTYRDFIQPEAAAGNADAAKLEGSAGQESPSEIRSVGDIRAQPTFRQSPRAQAGKAEDDGCLRGDGHQFDHAAFVRSRTGSDKAQEFLRQFRHSQLFEVFINERLKLASQGYKSQDTFESKVAEACSRRAKALPDFLSRAGSMVPPSKGSFSGYFQKTREAVKTFAKEHRLTSEDNELFAPSREGSFVRPSGASFSARSGSSFTARRMSHTNGPPSLQRNSGSPGGPPNLQRFSAVARDVTNVKAQINGIIHETSLPYYDGSANMPAHQILPTRQTSTSLPSQAPLPHARNRGTPTRLAQQGSADLGDLGVSSVAGMSRITSQDSGHISGHIPQQQHHESWHSRLSRPSSDRVQRPAVQNASPFASIEAMLSSIPETLSGMPSMPSMPSVPSISEIERSMQSGWNSITGTLGLGNSLPEQQQPSADGAASAIAGWTAFQDSPSTAHPTQPAQPVLLLAQQPVAGTSSQADLDPFAQLSSARTGSTAAPAASTSTPIGLLPGNSLARSLAEQTPASRSGSFSLSRKPATGLQSIDPLNAAKEAASVPLRSMASAKQPLTPRGSQPQSQHHAPSTSTNDAPNVSLPASLEGSPSNIWTDFASAPISNVAEQQGKAAQGPMADQPGSSADPWSAWAGQTALQQSLKQDQVLIQHLDAASKQASLLDL